MTPTTIDNLVDVDPPHGGSADICTFPPSIVERRLAAESLSDADKVADLFRVCGSKARAETIRSLVFAILVLGAAA